MYMYIHMHTCMYTYVYIWYRDTHIYVYMTYFWHISQIYVLHPWMFHFTFITFFSLLCFNLGNLYWPIFRFTYSFLYCVKCSREPLNGIFYLCYCAFFYFLLFYLNIPYSFHLPSEITCLILCIVSLCQLEHLN